MVYVTGDTHGDLTRFKDPQMKKLRKGDTLIICGDFGFIWNGSKQERSALRKLAAKDFTIAFIDGCHENFDILESYPTETWNGGMARVIAPTSYTSCADRFTLSKASAFSPSAAVTVRTSNSEATPTGGSVNSRPMRR